MSQNFRNFFVILSCILALTHAGMIYRRYEKEHPKQKYVQIVEIFETIKRPPFFIENERALNDFLGREAFRSDMNCTEDKSNEKTTEESKTIKPQITTTKRMTTSTTKRVPTSTTTKIFQLSTDSMVTYSPLPFPKLTTPPPRTTSTIKPPDLDHIFTIRSTKPTIKPNPKENVNPDYTALDGWSSPLPFESITNTPKKSTTTHAVTSKEQKNTLESIYSEEGGKSGRKTTTTTEVPRNEDEYSDIEDDYNSNNYPIIDSDEVGDFDEQGPEDYDEIDEDEYNETNRRKRKHAIRKRLSRKRHTENKIIS